MMDLDLHSIQAQLDKDLAEAFRLRRYLQAHKTQAHRTQAHKTQAERLRQDAEDRNWMYHLMPY
jgi:Skp family chaperone for outer membrane proteins